MLLLLQSPNHMCFSSALESSKEVGFPNNSSSRLFPAKLGGPGTWSREMNHARIKGRQGLIPFEKERGRKFVWVSRIHLLKVLASLSQTNSRILWFLNVPFSHWILYESIMVSCCRFSSRGSAFLQIQIKFHCYLLPYSKTSRGALLNYLNCHDENTTNSLVNHLMSNSSSIFHGWKQVETQLKTPKKQLGFVWK